MCFVSFRDCALRVWFRSARMISHCLLFCLRSILYLSRICVYFPVCQMRDRVSKDLIIVKLFTFDSCLSLCSHSFATTYHFWWFQNNFKAFKIMTSQFIKRRHLLHVLFLFSFHVQRYTCIVWNYIWCDEYANAMLICKSRSRWMRAIISDGVWH